MYTRDEIKVFYGNSNPWLAKKICHYLNIEEGKAFFSRFKDGEIKIKIEENVRGVDVFFVQPTQPPSDNLLELLLFLDAARRSSASRITAVIPYYGYARQDRKDEPRVPISSKLIADMIEVAGASRVLTLDLHAEQIQGFFKIPVDHLYATPVFVSYLQNTEDLSNTVVVSPDPGRANRARAFAKRLGGLPIAIIDKRRDRPNEAVAVNVVGDVKGKNCIIFDDIIDTGGTIIEATRALMDNNAAKVIAVATHGVLSADAVERLHSSMVESILITDSLPVNKKKLTEKFKILSVAELLGEAIRRIHNAESVSALFI